MLESRSVLVTGAGGFLGQVVAAHLEDRGARVVGADRSGEIAGLLPVNLEEPAALARLDDRGPFDAVVHCAALLPGDRTGRDVLMANLQMTHDLAAWAGGRGVKRFVLASTCNVYGYQSLPCTEDAVPHPPSLYATSKLACEHILTALSAQVALQPCCLRIAAPYGPHQRRDTVVSRFLRQAAKREPITLLGSGSRSQHFVYETDVAEAFALAVGCDAVGAFNVSGDAPTSMRALAEAASGLFGNPAPVRCDGDDPQEHYRGHFPTGAAQRALGYRPLVTIGEGLRLTAQAWSLS